MMTVSYRTLVDFGLVILIWLVQLIIYPGFRYCSPSSLAIWHPTYSNLITLIVGPLMLAQVALIGRETYLNASWITVSSAGLVALMWVATAFVSVPIHNAIAAGDTSTATLARLVDTNWIRTIGWTILFILGLISHARTETID
ncbi:hypothetical protein [Fibrivirga algicola]|nr:hypothetical protein [Fibrivirga algicola]